MSRMTQEELRELRGGRMAMVYQDPMSSLNPVMPVGRQLMEVPIIHQKASEAEARARALFMLGEVNLPDPESVFDRYPHQLSGGQQQRVVIASALMAEPSLLLMDEPTTGLDVTVEAAVLDLVRRLREKHNSSIVFISHNLGTVVRICDRIGVMYAGELVEEGPIGEVFRDPRHPYTRGLLNCIPVLGSNKTSAALAPIPGQVPSTLNRPPGCIFSSRCSYVDPPRCTAAPIPTITMPGSEHHRAQARHARPAHAPAAARVAAPHLPAVALAKRDREDVLTVDHLSKFYRQSPGIFSGGDSYDVKALNDIDMSAKRGMTLAIVGESGFGKSTFAKVMTGIEQATGGKVILDGIDIGYTPVEKRPDSLKRKLQMVFQNPDSTLNPSHSVVTTPPDNGWC
jgi:peptide/nickel transport system ATP-binding protein